MELEDPCLSQPPAFYASITHVDKGDTAKPSASKYARAMFFILPVSVDG